MSSISSDPASTSLSNVADSDKSINHGTSSYHVRLTSRKGYGLIASDKRTVVRMFTVGLFSLGVLGATLIAYQELIRPAKPNLISKDEAVQAAIWTSNWEGHALRNVETDAILLHVKENGFTFVVDQVTLQDTVTLDGHKFPEYQGQYLWIIQFTGTGNLAGTHLETIVDASSSEVLMRA